MDPIPTTSEVHALICHELTAKGVGGVARLLDQYRLALLDISVVAGAYGQPKQDGSPLEQVLFIAVHRGLGLPT